MKVGFKRFIVPATIFIMLFSALIISFELIHVRKFPFVDDPVKFGVNYQPVDEDNTSIKIQRTLEGIRIISPVFPYMKAKILQIINDEGCHFINDINISKEGRSLIVDPLWKVFWISITRCGNETQYFGPFRYKLL